MSKFVAWRSKPNEPAPPPISNTIQPVSVGQAFRFGFSNYFDWIKVGPNDPSMGVVNKREIVESSSNNITWFEIVGTREGHVLIDAIDTNTGYRWDVFQLAIGKSGAKKRPAIKGVNYNYYVDTTGIGPNWNASIVIVQKFALIPIRGGLTITDTTGTNWTSQYWSNKEWNAWVWKFKKLIEGAWSEKMWLATPASLHELEVDAPGGGKRRVNLHCVYKVEFAVAGAAHQEIRVLKTNATSSVAFGSDSKLLDKADLLTDSPAVSGFINPFNTAIHEIGHNLGLHHPCEVKTPATPYCVSTDPDNVEVMGMGDQLRARYATPWQNAAATWFSTNGGGTTYKPIDFTPSLSRLAPVVV
ncbi:hypothetical protein [Terrarubrum flagellatum]|uniref:hypothetical protein n=1 Tax=Terrirubrum flagellatum TaxID=2895980 RepID=UPI0031454B3E